MVACCSAATCRRPDGSGRRWTPCPRRCLTAVITPAVIAGSPEMTAAALTLLVALRLPMIVAVLVGMASVAILRAAWAEGVALS